MTEEIISTSSDHIPTKKVVQIIGDISVKKAMWFSERPDVCIEKLKEKAKQLGANAIINVIYQPCGALGWNATCRGLAVKVEDEK